MSQYLPEIFLGLMGLAILIYAILDGYDLGVGILLPADSKASRNKMIASIGPFWDANETWLVLAIGILLIAFPTAHSLVLEQLYLPVAVMLIGLILRGVAFDFRAKAITHYQNLWDTLFKVGSVLASLSQGYGLGLYVMGFEQSWQAYGFALLSAVCVTAAYAYIGGAWLVLKTEGELQKFAARKARRAGWLTTLGIIAISVANPLLRPDVAERWLSLPNVILLAPVPLLCAILVFITDRYLRRVPHQGDFACWLPFTSVASLFTISLLGMAYSYFPYVVPGQMTAQEAASATESLMFIGWGVVIVLPVILAYTAMSYWIFRGKTQDLNYY